MKPFLQLSCGIFVLCGMAPTRAQSPSELTVQQLQRQQQRERAQSEQAEEKRPDVRLPRAPALTGAAYPADEKPCFPIREITLTGEGAPRRTGPRLRPSA